jgi:L-ascorbate metabolism protein UlaG (beta-lactamase superfamily)
VKKRLKIQLPDTIDLLLVPIDWKKTMFVTAVDYVEFLPVRNIIPMHYWSLTIKSDFLKELASRNKKYKIAEEGKPTYDVFVNKPRASYVEVISLEAGPYSSAATSNSPGSAER